MGIIPQRANKSFKIIFYEHSIKKELLKKNKNKNKRQSTRQTSLQVLKKTLLGTNIFYILSWVNLIFHCMQN
jgi:hypothetical protein